MIVFVLILCSLARSHVRLYNPNTTSNSSEAFIIHPTIYHCEGISFALVSFLSNSKNPNPHICIGTLSQTRVISPNVEKTDPVDNIVGRYSTANATLHISEIAPRSYRITGTAFWSDQSSNQATSGDIDGKLNMNSSTTGTYTDGDCNIEFVFSNNSLSAEDNLKCGGINVSFTGNYIRQ